jgi:antitoxin (DNA-binding transcriptional repressor) of toxin-antitoxin stability system
LSDTFGAVTEITATEAARNFSKLLDDIEHGRRRYTVTRGGKAVASVGPAGPNSVTVRDLLDRLRGAPRPDDRFGEDLRRARRALGTLSTDDPWES